MDKIVNVLTMNVSDTNLSKVVNYVGTKAITKEGSYICVSNVHMCMETFDDPTFENIVNSADLIIPDGRPISWAQKLLGSKTLIPNNFIVGKILNKTSTKSLELK